MFKFEIEKRPEFAWLKILIPAGKKVFVESGSMATMTSNLSLKILSRGFFKRFLSRESLFLSEFKADGFEGELCLAPGPFGDVGCRELKQETFYLASTSYLAHTEGLEYQTKFQKLSQGLLSGAGWFLVKMSGTGQVWFNGYGQLVELDVHDELTIDNGHVVGFSEGVEYDIIKLGGYKSLFFSGEGFVCKFRGKGQVILQTKKPAALIDWADSFRRVESSNNN